MERTASSQGALRDGAPARIVIVGPPGAGAGRSGDRLAEALGLVHISTASLFAREGASDTPTGRAARRSMEQGLLVPDLLVVRAVADAIERQCNRPPEPQGFVLTGFPRTIRQAEALDALIRPAPVDLALKLEPAEPDLGLRRRDLTAVERVRAQRRLSSFRRLTVPALAWMARRRPVVTIGAGASRDDMLRRLRPLLNLDGISAPA